MNHLPSEGLGKSFFLMLLLLGSASIGDHANQISVRVCRFTGLILLSPFRCYGFGWSPRQNALAEESTVRQWIKIKLPTRN